MLNKLCIAAVALATVTPAVAGERTATEAIQKGDFRAAERTLVAERRIFPERPELMLNLAAVYARTARPDAARVLYDDVLARDPVAMDMPSGAVVSSHDVALLGLKQLDGAGRFASR